MKDNFNLKNILQQRNLRLKIQVYGYKTKPAMIKYFLDFSNRF